MNYLFLFKNHYISLLPLLEFEQFVWDQFDEPVIWNTNSQFPDDHIIGYVDIEETQITEYYNFIINKYEILMESNYEKTTIQ